MRIDKFLKVSRILKRRAVSKELALNERIEINGRVVKPSHEVNPGDIVGITFGNRKLEVRVLAHYDTVNDGRKQNSGSSKRYSFNVDRSHQITDGRNGESNKDYGENAAANSA